MIPLPYSVIPGSLLAIGLHFKVHKLFNRMLKKCVKQLFKKKKNDYYNIKYKMKKSQIFAEMKRRIRVHSCPLPQNRRNQDGVVDVWHQMGNDEIAFSKNRGFLLRDHSPFTDKRPSLRTDLEEVIEHQTSAIGMTDQVIDRSEQGHVIYDQMLVINDQDLATDADVYTAKHVSQTFIRSYQPQVSDFLDLTSRVQDQHNPNQEEGYVIYDQIFEMNGQDLATEADEYPAEQVPQTFTRSDQHQVSDSPDVTSRVQNQHNPNKEEEYVIYDQIFQMKGRDLATEADEYPAEQVPQTFTRSDQYQVSDSPDVTSRVQDHLIHSQELGPVIYDKVLVINPQSLARDAYVYTSEQVSQTFTRSGQHQVSDSPEVANPVQDQLIHSQEPERGCPDPPLDSQVFEPLRLEDGNNHLAVYSQSFQDSNFSDTSLSTFTEETGSLFTNSNPFLVSETVNLQSLEEERDESLVTGLHELQVEIINHWAVQLFPIFSNEETKNFLFSPFSISAFMGILVCEDVENDVFEEPKPVYSLISQFHTLQFVNAILVQNCLEFKQENKEILAEFFKTLLLEVDFLKEDEETVSYINEWANMRASGIIPMIIEYLDPSTVLYNAAYFQATWTNQFDKRLTSLVMFYNCGAEGDTKVIDMMFKTEYFLFYEDEDVQVLELPCKEQKVAMLILLPRAKDGLALVERSLNPCFIQRLKVKLLRTRVHVGLPRFRVEYTKRLAPYLHHFVSDYAPGAIARIFSDVAASHTLHKAVLKVNEYGCNMESNTETTAKMDYFLGFNPQFIADHPFVFVIFDKMYDIILLMGRINDP